MVRKMSFNGKDGDGRSLSFLKDHFSHENLIVSSIATKKVGGNTIHVFHVEGFSDERNGFYQVSSSIAENWKVIKMKETIRKYKEPVKVYFYRGESGRCVFEEPRDEE